jgi:hypothetical protein
LRNKCGGAARSKVRPLGSHLEDGLPPAGRRQDAPLARRQSLLKLVLEFLSRQRVDEVHF